MNTPEPYTPGAACVIFEIESRRYEYDGEFPEALDARIEPLLDADGFWRGGYPDSLAEAMKSPDDTLPTVLWEIEKIGGRVLEIQGMRPDGSVLLEDWKQEIIY